MNTIGVVLLAAASATSGIGKPHVGGHRIFRPHAIQSGPPTSAPITGAGMGGPGADGGAAGNRRFPNDRSQVFFVDPANMKVSWQTGGANGERIYLPPQLNVPARYNFMQGYIYRLKINEIPGHPGLTLYPTLEIAGSTPATDAYLTHNPIPCQFTEEDFDQVTAGNFVTKVIYLPDPKYQELAIAGVETLVSTRLEPGVDPILEADRRGTILMIIRIGAIDLEMPANGTGLMAPGLITTPSGVPYVQPGEMSPLETAPVAPAPATDAPSVTPPPAAAPPAPAAAPPAPAVAPPPPPPAADAPTLNLPAPGTAPNP